MNPPAMSCQPWITKPVSSSFQARMILWCRWCASYPPLQMIFRQISLQVCSIHSVKHPPISKNKQFKFHSRNATTSGGDCASLHRRHLLLHNSGLHMQRVFSALGGVYLRRSASVRGMVYQRGRDRLGANINSFDFRM